MALQTNSVLAGLLALQVGLGIVTWWPSSEGGNASTSLLGAETTDITKLVITGTEGEGAAKPPLTLEKKDGGWVLSDYDDYPADGAKVDPVLEGLAALKVRAPIATQALSHANLKVAADDFGKKVAVEANGTATTLFLGAASANAVHVRKDGDNDVYLGRGLTEWKIRDNANSYIDTKYVSVDDPEAFAIQNDHGNLSFFKKGGQWEMERLAEGEQSDSEAIDQLAKKVKVLYITEPAGKKAPEMGLKGGARVTLTTTAEGGSEETSWHVGAKVDGDKVYVGASGLEHAVKVQATRVQPVLDAKREDFLAKPDVP